MNDMIFGIAIIFVIYLLWVLLVKGALWKLILFFAGGFGIYVGLKQYIPESNHTVVIFDCPISWAAVIAIGLCILTLLTTEVKKS